jgi:hypothetical protein
MKLISNVLDLYENTEFMKDVEELAESRYNSNNNSRARDVVFSNAKVGLLGEKAMLRYNGELRVALASANYRWDLEDDNFHYEIKTSSMKTEWWNIHRNTKSGLSSYDWFLKAAAKGQVDYIIKLFLEEQSGDVFMVCKAKAASFLNDSFLCKSNYNDGWYYNMHIAAKRGQCIMY